MSWSVEIRMKLGSLDLELSMESDGGTVALIGPNGAGKSTVLRTIAGAYSQVQGRILLQGRVVFDSKSGVALAPESRRIAYVPQGFGLFPHLNVLENVAFAWRAQRPHLSRKEHEAAACAMLEEMGCAQLASREIKQLSGGEKQRVALARALMVEPQLLLLDEPFAALDITARRSMRAFLKSQLESREIPAIVVSHDARDIKTLDASLYVLEQGRVVQQGAPADLAANPETEFVAEFFDAEAPASAD